MDKIITQHDHYLGKEYTRLSASDKMDRLWGLIRDDNLEIEPINISVCNFYKHWDTKSVFEEQDIMPWGKGKVIHSFPSVFNKIKIVIDSGDYSGSLARGMHYGIIRFGATSTYATSSGIGIKIFRDNIHSGNMVFLNGINLKDVGKSKIDPMFNDTYGTEYTTKIKYATTTVKIVTCPIEKKFFGQYTSHPERCGLSDFTKYDTSGTECDINIFPDEVMLRLADEYKNISRKEACDKSGPGSKMFTIHAKQIGNENFEEIGYIELTDGLIESTFGDNMLFFQHQLYEEDLRLTERS